MLQNQIIAIYACTMRVKVASVPDYFYTFMPIEVLPRVIKAIKPGNCELRSQWPLNQNSVN